MIWKEQLCTQIISSLPEDNPIESMFKYFNINLKTYSKTKNSEDFTLFIIFFLQFVKTMWPKQAQSIEAISSTNPTYIEKIMEWIEENYTKEFHLNLLSTELHLSQYYIAHLFHNATGANITEYLIARRMRQSCLLLKNSSLSVQQICHEVGLTNVSYFCKKFKEYTGKTPLKYRTFGSINSLK